MTKTPLGRFAVSLAALVFAVLASGPTPARAAAATATDPCAEARAEFDALLLSLPIGCKKNADCEAYYSDDDSCAHPVVLAKAAYAKVVDHEMVPLQNQVRSACAEQFKHQPVCRQIPVVARCRKGKCAEAKAPSP